MYLCSLYNNYAFIDSIPLMIYVTFCIELKIDKRGFHPVFLFNFSILNKGRIIDDQKMPFMFKFCITMRKQWYNNGAILFGYWKEIN